jgi:hypothetical protein
LSSIGKRHFEAGREMVDILAAKLGKNRAVHSETVISAGARMAGTMLFRSFGLDTTKMSPGSAILSEEANEKGPELVNIVASMLHHYGLSLDQEMLRKASGRGEAPRFTVTEIQELFEEDFTRVRVKHALDLIGGARACALAVAFLVRECAPSIGLEVGFNTAAYGLIEGCKTVPIASAANTKRQW